MDFKEIYESFERENRIDKIANEEDVKNYTGVTSVGDKFSIFPPPETREKALEWLEKYYGAIEAEVLVSQFKSKFPIEVRPLQDQLKKINQFIEEADSMNSVDAVEGTNLNKSNKDHYEYLKWKCGHYKVAPFYSSHTFISSDLKRVYGKYVLYKKWLEEELRNILVSTPIIKQKEALNFFETKNTQGEITIFERIKRELNTIQWICSSQSMTVENDFDGIINEDGRVCLTINIRSDRPLNLIEDYKQHYTDRFENAKTQVVVRNELIEIYHKARYVYNLFKKAIFPALNDLLVSYDSNPKLRIETESYRSMIILVVDYHPKNILFGYKSNSTDQRTLFTIRDYNYVVKNADLVDFCLDLINFINTFEIPALMSKENEETITMKDDLEVEIAHRSEKPFLFESNQSAELNTKHPKHNPNIWNARCYELFKYLFENYYSGKKTQLMNIWFFLKSDIGTDYTPNPPRDLYLKFIFEEYEVKITNYDKPDNWFEKHLPILKGHLSNFEENI